ncbi:MAG: hypothetical protein A2W05_01745 [Candidatus Schekmanbacteria bacterium RBG_16_38_10]|uniref:asparagine synthase (glutamine-hydrolyzing) n=1 Tax=Candidatus Schekmanbacteria bacterium RBG_16_38_10 TaxID=1817879 RepID=A0A1F7RQ13_9BACT|nr:MAG: hypothetical protein A2W05_01745 [Candidatus Schekmanbacteria bacterium RBG_16_38_10]
MPGICGIISKTEKARNLEKVKMMVDCLVHEAFYTSGTYVNNQLGLYAGWACHAGSFSDCMPIFNEKKDLVLIFYGENFSDKEITDQLKGRGHAFDRSNASYLIHMYEEKGDQFLQDLNGWFNGVLIDLRKGKVILFNDLFGMQRIYYYESQDAFYFSSEAKSILKVIPESRQIDIKSLGEFFCCDCALENRTLFKNIFLLPVGSSWTFSNNSEVQRNCYLDAQSWENETLLEKEYFFERLKETFKKILPRYFRSEQKIGISLTGGLDTRIIMAYLEATPEKYPCYTFGGMYRDSFDVKIARRVAAACKQIHQVVSLDKKFLFQFPEYAERTVYLSDGGLDIGEAHELYINKLAREIAPLRITGNYGSEVLRGARFLRASFPREELFHKDFKAHLQNATKTYDSICGGHSLSFTLFKDLPWHEYSRLSIERSQLIPRSPYMDKDLIALMYRATPEVRRSKDVSLRLVEAGNEFLSSIMTDRGIGGKSNYLFRNMAHIFYEFLFKAEYAYNYGMPQWLARVDHVFAPLHLERLFLGRHKFHHFRIWYRDELSDYVRDVLLDERTLSRPYFNRVFIQHMVRSHTEGYRNYTTEITKILTAELIHRLLIET